jgi:hypothetical protein
MRDVDEHLIDYLRRHQRDVLRAERGTPDDASSRPSALDDNGAILRSLKPGEGAPFSRRRAARRIGTVVVCYRKRA